jgi:hypothetical protein
LERRGLPDRDLEAGAPPGPDPFERIADWLEGHVDAIAILGGPEKAQIAAPPGGKISREAAEKD